MYQKAVNTWQMVRGSFLSPGVRGYRQGREECGNDPHVMNQNWRQVYELMFSLMEIEKSLESWVYTQVSIHTDAALLCWPRGPRNRDISVATSTLRNQSLVSNATLH